MDFIELLNDPAYLHMLLNHIPIIGLTLAFGVLMAGLISRQSPLLFMGLALVAVTAGASIPVAQYGDAAYPAIFDALDGHGRAWLDYHVHLAETWLPVLYANTALAVIALGLGILRRPLLLRASLLVTLMTIASIVGAGLVGKAGGRIKHPEFRLDDPPVVPSARRL